MAVLVYKEKTFSETDRITLIGLRESSLIVYMEEEIFIPCSVELLSWSDIFTVVPECHRPRLYVSL